LRPEPGARPVSTPYTVTLVLMVCTLGIGFLADYFAKNAEKFDSTVIWGLIGILSIAWGYMIAYAILHFRCWRALPARLRDGVSPGANKGVSDIYVFEERII
jgi:hypothetical protein